MGLEIKTKAEGPYQVITINTYSTIYLSIGPTQNCQLMSLGSFQQALLLEGNKFKYDIKEIFRYIYNNIVAKKLIILDLKEGSYRNLFDTWCEENDVLIMRERYKSTNNSNMCLYLINIQKIL